MTDDKIKSVIPGVAHCFFEQSGTFKREFIKLGIKAYDYDIQDNFDETDYVCDLFGAINKAYEGGESLFDKITPDDVIMAFFPCIYFCESNTMRFCGNSVDEINKDPVTKIDMILKRADSRHYLYTLILKLCSVCESRGLRLIIENPYSVEHYLYNNFPYKPGLIDRNRRAHGDLFSKPTQYFFINLEPHGFKSHIKPERTMTVRQAKNGIKAGICSEERSMIAPQYAEAFIRDVILNLDEGTYTYQRTINFSF